MKRIRIRINLDRLRANVSNADARIWSEADVLRWLCDAGFTPDGDAWLTTEADLGQLEPEEVTAVEDVDDTSDIPVRTRHSGAPRQSAGVARPVDGAGERCAAAPSGEREVSVEPDAAPGPERGTTFEGGVARQPPGGHRALDIRRTE